MKKILSCLLIVIVLFSIFSCLPINAERNNTINNDNTVENATLGYGLIDYATYLEKNSEAKVADNEIVINASDFSVISADSKIQKTNYAGKENVLLWDSEKGSAEYTFTISESALYSLKFEYLSIPHKKLDLLFSFELDGEYPFSEAQKLYLDKIYTPDGAISQNKSGDDVSPKLFQNDDWIVSNAKNDNYDENICVYLAAGTHSIKICFYQEPLVLSKIIFSEIEQIPSYSDYSSQYDVEQFPKGVVKKYEAESVKSQSVTLNLLHTDKSSSKTSPYSYHTSKLNVVGGENWSSAGEWIEWEISVPEDGWYNINMRYSQSYNKGMPTLRRMFINGKVPFIEADNCKFNYCENWGWFSVNNSKGEELPIWLNKGPNTLRLEVISGEVSEIIRSTEDIIYNLNEIYRKIIMITGSSPDTYRDYQIEKQIPDLVKTFEIAIDELENSYNYFEKLSRDANSASVLKVLSEQLSSFLKKPDTIPSRTSSFNGNIGSLSAWISELRKQPLDIDFIYVSSVGEEAPKINENFFQSVYRELKLLIYSFSKDYNNTNSNVVGNKEIDVWMNSGRDQMAVVKRIVEEDFETQHNIFVNLKLVTTNLIQAFLSGVSPDCMIQVARGTPVDLALRGALTDMSKFSDFDDVILDFQNTAMNPYVLNNGCYGMPDSQSFYMLFYRKDILQELGLSVPQTWDEFIYAIEVIQRNNMAVGVPYEGIDSSGASSAGIGTKNIFSALLLQNGGSFFNDDLTRTALMEENSKKAFRTWTELYSDYGLELSYDFFNRFRTGEMPLAIQIYTSYNQLSVAAPEIAGLWEMTMIPGTVTENGSVDRSQGAAGTATVIPSTTDNSQEAWEFVKFWVSEETQTRYSIDIEAQLGVGGRYAPANMKALANMSWTTKEVAVISEQWKSIKDINNIPGGYYLIRGLDNAFKDAVYNNKDAYRTLAAWDKEINAEIARKREEFNLE